MKTIEVNGYLTLTPYGNYVFSTCSMKGEPGWVDVKPVQFTVEIPPGFDPVQAQVDSLRTSIAEVKKEAAAKVTALETRIANLLCIENSPSSEEVTA